MFQLSPQDIHLGAAAADKQEAIRQVAAALTDAGCVSAGYVDGMLQRELQTSTYLGNGIAIPHGTTDTRDLVLKTGVQVFQFPQGIAWGGPDRLCGDRHRRPFRRAFGAAASAHPRAER